MTASLAACATLSTDCVMRGRVPFCSLVSIGDSDRRVIASLKDAWILFGDPSGIPRPCCPMYFMLVNPGHPAGIWTSEFSGGGGGFSEHGNCDGLRAVGAGDPCTTVFGSTYDVTAALGTTEFHGLRGEVDVVGGCSLYEMQRIFGPFVG